ncbi:type II toxin-antitoxin system HipA family toxin [Comamonas thiooxydans]|uniref:Type II toxin-antitoxin system HipA family toxin n=1 Tax=Comamonas thiooxydans TaxID=363952 RepID=A0AA42TU90_9BURK|nr:type II toxin-antitoxin system HipA family toxin [Comamonas thiooxydans]MDH1334980.1 type II toxin-antitoxin system HipA family toxin [Comamonas thiooxydans]MDH1741131.1 type II toxin-antitoxin system HipA family toxin [Comamonas thiooxydans]MDH1787473.1 type II toxin-antitoxin system HipA family toxin [Comamonas thiooxydans]
MSEIAKPVWIWLPGQAEPVHAGTFTWAEGTKPVGAFVYDTSYLARADMLPLDQGQLKFLKRRPLKATRNVGLYDVFKDVKPEGFGLHILTRKHSRSSITDLEALEFSAGDTVGALAVCDDIAQKALFIPHTAEDLFEAMKMLAPGTRVGQAGGSLENIVSTGLGGERPKSTVLFKGQQWIAKFAGSKDGPSSTLREFLAMRLAALSGINTAEVDYVHEGTQGTVLVKRFDRHVGEDGTVLRTHFASAATVMGTDKAVAGTRTYPMIAQYASRWLVPDFKDELWRRIAFNVLIGNGDDHAHNHGFLLGPKGWELSPAYDIAPYTLSDDKVHPVKALSTGLLRSGEADATADVLLLCAKELDVDYDYANNYLDATYALIREQWDSLAESVGQKPLQPPLFELPPLRDRLSKVTVAAHRYRGR